MSVSEDDYVYFPRCSDTQFWADNSRVETLISLYHSNECLWNSRCADYKKSQTKKKTAKERIGAHFGLTGAMCSYSFTLSYSWTWTWTGTSVDSVLFCSFAVFDPRVGHTMDVLSLLEVVRDTTVVSRIADTADTTVVYDAHGRFFYFPTKDLAPFSIHIATKNPRLEWSLLAGMGNTL